MRTTVTLDPDVKELVERAMRERGLTFKDAINQAVRDARLAAELEDDEIVRKLELRK